MYVHSLVHRHTNSYHLRTTQNCPECEENVMHAVTQVLVDTVVWETSSSRAGLPTNPFTNTHMYEHTHS